MATPRLNINKDISKAHTLSSEFYNQNHFFELCKETIFKKSWQLITDTKIFNKYNTYPFYFLEGLLNEPMIFINSGNEKKCFTNVCTHRAHLIVQKSCKIRRLQCPYHGRRYNLNGTFEYMPGFDGVKNFPSDSDNLNCFPSLEWKSFIFTSLSPKIRIKGVLDDIDKRLSNFPFHKLILDKNKSATYEIDAHWAIYCENYLEGFHVPFVHSGLNKDINLQTYETILLENGVLQLAEATKDVEKFQFSTSTTNSGKNIYALYYWIFPNLMLNFYPWGLSVNIIEPLGVNKTRIKFLSYPIKPKTQPMDNPSSLDKVELEDQSVVKQVQKGIKSLAYKPGRYSVIHEKGVHHFHRLIVKYL